MPHTVEKGTIKASNSSAVICWEVVLPVTLLDAFRLQVEMQAAETDLRTLCPGWCRPIHWETIEEVEFGGLRIFFVERLHY